MMMLQTIALICGCITMATGCSKTMINGHGVTNGDKNMILDYHNRMRQSVAMGQISGQPTAANMMEMKWDDELAQRAQKWTTSCLAETHDGARHSSRFPVGQNIATMWTTARPRTALDMMANFDYAIGRWFDEYKYYSYGPINPYSHSTAHYTQMIWAETNLIGCGFAFYFDAAKGFTKNYVCNYGSSGNVVGQLPYAKGRPSCERFNLVPSRKYTGLCDKSNRYFYDLQTNYIG
ncbi:PREDICTED: venom allergen 5-like [Nicrophorus vespilloides]|uniref:Venom allergen 5-like n=1 Tax=Nicrophorus vespilloides TaxID=110193 RepID=A0ABM1MHK2_NICVS|nr:PREDICTED: venom allergen 5-like [Nicrophorus vespilloides]